MSFPFVRHRRLRRNQAIRRLVSETGFSIEDIIVPLFIKHGGGVKSEISSLPGHFHWSADTVVEEAFRLKKMGVQGVLLFGIPETKDETGSSSYADDGVVQSAIRSIKNDVPDLLLAADLCFCEYTDHGHCGVLVDGEVDNDKTLVETGIQALSLAQAGADIIAPSGMMDGVVSVVRRSLDEGGFKNTVIMSYAAKYASAYYGPFREAAGSEPSFGDRLTYQMDPANSDEAIREIESDISEGADIVMVKPALAYLDVIYRAKSTFPVPVAAYSVSGEYAMIQQAAKNGLVDGDKIIFETLLSIKRAGADILITYFADDLARIL